MANSLSTKELAFELLSHIKKVNDDDKDDDGVLPMMDDRPTQSSRTSPMSLVGL